VRLTLDLRQLSRSTPAVRIEGMLSAGVVGMEDDPGGIRQRHHRRRAYTACAVLLAVAVLTICVWSGPVWLTGTGLTAAQRLDAGNAVRSTLLSGLAGLLALGGVALGAWVTLRQVRASREGNTIGLSIKAIELLASDDASVRQGVSTRWSCFAALMPAIADRSPPFSPLSSAAMPPGRSRGPKPCRCGASAVYGWRRR
jgi:hypothetical protein